MGIDAHCPNEFFFWEDILKIREKEKIEKKWK